MAGYGDLAASGFIDAGDLSHDLAGRFGQFGRPGREGATGADGDDHLVFLTVDGDKTLADLLAKRDFQFVFGDLGLFTGFLLRLGIGMLLLRIGAVGLNRGFRSGCKLRQLLLKAAEQHFLIRLACGFLGLLDRIERFLKQLRQLLVLGFGRGEIHHDILAQNLDLDIAAGDGIFQRLDDILGRLGLAAVIILFALLHFKVRLGDVGCLLCHVLGDGR